MRFPKTLTGKIKRLAGFSESIKAIQEELEATEVYKLLEETKSAYKELEQNILSTHSVSELEQTGQLKVTQKVNYTITDWDAFSTYAYETDSLDLFQRRVTPTAVKEREADGIEIPGLDKYTNVTIKPI